MSWYKADLAGLIAVLQSGSRPKGGASVDTGEVMSLGGENILQQGGVDLRDVKQVPQAFYEAMIKGHLQDRDVLINKDGANTGKVGLFRDPDDGSACINEHLFLLRGTTAKITQEYLYYTLLSEHGQTIIRNRISGSAQPGLKSGFINNFPINLPESTDEQGKISDILGSLDTAIEQTETIIAKQQRIKTGLMQDLLTKGIDEDGNIRSEATHAFKDSPLGRIPVEWDVRSCGELCTAIVVGIVVRPTQYYKDSGVPVLRSANVREDQVTTVGLVFMSEDDNRALRKSQVRKGDLITVRTGYPGTTAVVPQELDGANCVDIVILRPEAEKIRSNYLAMWINSDFGKKQVLEGQGGLAQQHFNVGQMRKLLVKTPPTKEQEQIEYMLLAHRENEGCLYKELKKLERKKVGLMRDLLTGERRVTALLAQAAPQ